MKKEARAAGGDPPTHTFHRFQNSLFHKVAAGLVPDVVIGDVVGRAPIVPWERERKRERERVRDKGPGWVG